MQHQTRKQLIGLPLFTGGASTCMYLLKYHRRDVSGYVKAMSPGLRTNSEGVFLYEVELRGADCPRGKACSGFKVDSDVVLKCSLVRHS